MVLGDAAFWVNQADEVAVGIVVKVGDGVKAGAVFLQAHELAQAVVLVVRLTVFMVAGLANVFDLCDQLIQAVIAVFGAGAAPNSNHPTLAIAPCLKFI